MASHEMDTHPVSPHKLLYATEHASQLLRDDANAASTVGGVAPVVGDGAKAACAASKAAPPAAPAQVARDENGAFSSAKKPTKKRRSRAMHEDNQE